MSGYNRGSFQQPVTGNFQNSGMGGFQGSQMGGIQPYGGFQNRGGLLGGMRGGPIGIRGGRGGMNPGGMMGMPMTGMSMGAMGGMGMSMPQLNGGGMGLQGMQGSYFHTHMNPAGLHGMSASPARRSLALIPKAMHFTTSTATISPPFSICEPRTPHLSNGPSSIWAHVTHYSPSSACSSPACLSSIVEAPGTTPSPYQHSTTLAERSLLTFTKAHYNPAFFTQQQGQPSSSSGDAIWNPHGAKRTRQE